MSDPIKAAFAASAEALFSALVATEKCADPSGCDLMPCHCSQIAAAAAVVAFLRSAADVHAGCYAAMEPREMLKHLTAAVERAAKEVGDE